MSSDAPILAVSSLAERRHARAQEWLEAQKLDRGFLLIAPSRGAADDFLRRLARQGQGVLGAYRYTLSQLAWEEASASLAEEGVARLGELGGEAMATLASAKALDGGRLKTLGPVAEMPGFPRALSATLMELRLADVDRERLRTLPGAGPDLAVLLEGYEQELQRWGLADRARLLARATCNLEGQAASQQLGRPHVGRAQEGWRGAPTLWIDLELRSRLEIRFLSVLCKVTGPILMTVAEGDDESLAAGVRVLKVEPTELDPLAWAADLSEAEDSGPGEALRRVQRFVFAAKVPEKVAPEDESPDEDGPEEIVDEPSRASATLAASDTSLVFFSAAGEGNECVEIARRVRDLAERGVRFDEIAVFVRQPQGYLPLIEDAFRRAELPAYFSHGTTRPDPAGRAFLALLACTAEGLPASRFAEYLSLGQVPSLDQSAEPLEREVPWVEPRGEQLILKTLVAAGEERAPDEGAQEDSEPIDSADLGGPAIAGSLPTPSRWERMLVDAAVVGGADRWQRRLEGLDAELERRAREAGDEDELLRSSLERTIERLGHLRAFALPLVRSLDELPKEATWGVWLERLERLAVQSLRRPESVLGLLAELRPLSEVDRVSLAHVRQVLGERLSFLRAEPPRRRYGRVFVGTLKEAAGRAFEVVFVPGLAEGVFPRRAVEDPLLLDEHRERLDQDLTQRDRRVGRERLLLRLAAGAARSGLVVSYPRVDTVGGRARVPSFYALDVLRAAEGRVPDLKSLARRVASGVGSILGGYAPSEREQAIDDAEYDLALLQDLLRRPAGESTGEGRFLLFVNDHLKRSLRSRARRWRSRWTYADGLVASTDFEAESTATRTLLSAESPRKRSFSPTALQHFAACPYRFFLQAILRLRPREDRTGFEQLDPLTRGSIFHEMQFELQVELKKEGLLPVVEENIEQVLQRADEVLDRCIERFAEELAPAIPRVWVGEVEGLRNDLRGWLRQVAQAPGSWRPLHFELGFGLPLGPKSAASRDQASVAEPVKILGGRAMRGAIDLVEIDASGRRIRVTDHKTGRPRRERSLVIAGGAVLQPLVYALVAEQLLGAAAKDQTRPPEGMDQEAPEVTAGRLYYCTQRGEFSELEVPLNVEGRRAVEMVLDQVEDSLKKGFLPAAPQEGACRWCDYRPVCGPYEEHRVTRKDQRRLTALRELRSHR